MTSQIAEAGAHDDRDQAISDHVSSAFARTRAHFAPGHALAQKLAGMDALEVAASGAEVRLSDGRCLIDFGSYGVTLLGHRPPRVIAAVSRQLATLPTSTRVLANDVAPALAARLCELAGDPRMQRVWLGQDGADAVEAALKLARVCAGRIRVIALRGAYHGKTLGALAATSYPRYRLGLEPLLEPAAVIVDDLGAAERALCCGDVAAVIFEPVQGEGGIVPQDRAFLAQLAALARRHGAFVISDEVQMGLRRCGPISLAVEMGLEPDAILLGKHLAGGVLPLAAVVCSDALYAPLMREPFLHTATFSGHPLSCAAGLAALEEIECTAAQGVALGQAVETQLRRLKRAHDGLIADVRGMGLAWGIEFASSEVAGEVLSELGPAGLIVSPCLGRPEVIRLLPPVVTSEAQLTRAFDALHAACNLASLHAQ